ncbi:hypothetical protein NDU88_007135 [Pleurodeles waltl]|uniref:Uncharacterized protein n=1 Tax=Pleurodeles waltl TaxID=8319 RepID=A0AAV7WGH7_PLEWA|nr:hypothetical protein NDU88_007135 [Pleurodeles waltl]
MGVGGLGPCGATPRRDAAEEAHRGQRVRRCRHDFEEAVRPCVVCGWEKVGADGSDAPREPGPAKRMSQTGPLETGCGDAAGPVLSESDGAPLTRAFMEQLFESLCDDLATLKREIAADVKDLKMEVIYLGQCVDTVEQAQDAREDELDGHRRELLSLQDKNQELQYQIEDLENRSRRSNIRVKGVPTQAIAGPLWCASFVTWRRP